MLWFHRQYKRKKHLTDQKKNNIYIYIYIYIQYIIYTEIRSEAFVLALQQKQLVPLLLVQGEPRTFPH